MQDGKPFAIDPALVAVQKEKNDTVDYLASLGDAHRDLWIRRLKKGMKPALKARFDSLVAEYAALPDAPAEQEVEFERVLPTEIPINETV